MMYWFQHRFSGSSPLQLPPVISAQWATAARPICVRVCVCACVLSVFVCSCMCVFVSAQAIEGGCSPQGSVDGLGAPVDNTDNQDQLFNQWTSSINTRARTTRLHAQTHTHETCRHSVSFREVEGETDVTLKLGGGLLSSSYWVLQANCLHTHTHTHSQSAWLCRAQHRTTQSLCPLWCQFNMRGKRTKEASLRRSKIH